MNKMAILFEMLNRMLYISLSEINVFLHSFVYIKRRMPKPLHGPVNVATINSIRTDSDYLSLAAST